MNELTPIEFDQVNVRFGATQKEYRPLPACRIDDPRHPVLCCWQMSVRDRIRFLFSGRIWQYVFTFGQPLQPQLFDLNKPEWVTFGKTKKDNMKDEKQEVT